MPTDVLAKYRTKPLEEAPEGALKPYTAFKKSAGGPARRLVLRVPDKSDWKLAYSHLTIVATDTWASIYLEYTHLPLVVFIHGYYLTELAELLDNDEVAWIQGFDAKRMQEPKDGEPLVTEIIVKFKIDPEERPQGTMH